MSAADKTTIHGDGSTSADVTANAADELTTGTSVGRYLVIERVGAGGMGAVYAAWDPELDRKVALKLVRTHWTSGSQAEVRGRLLREAQALARLNHPNVVTVHDVGTLDDEIFIAMEFVAGQTIGAWAKAATRGWQEVIAVYIQAGRGLAAAHGAGLVHRDFKPDNVMLDDQGRVLVMDFGVVRRTLERTESPASDAQRDRALVGPVTEAGAIVGTPAYMAPEQIVHGKADPRADQFSFCVALWETLYGERPFLGETLGELVSSALEGRTRDPPRGRNVPKHLRATLLRGLASEPADRFASMDELLIALAHDPIRRRRRGLVAIGVVVGVAAIATTVVLARDAREAAIVVECGRDAAALVAPWTDRRDDVRRAFAATDAAHAQSSFERVAWWLDAWTVTQVESHEQLCTAARRDGALDPRAYAAHLACFDEQRVRLGAFVGVFQTPTKSMIAGASKAAAAFAGLESCADPRTIASRPLPPADAESTAALEQIRGALARASALGDAGDYAGGARVAREALVQAEALHWGPVLAESRLVAASLESEVGEYRRCVDELTTAYGIATETGADMVAARAATMLQRVLGYHLARTAEGRAWGTVAGAWLTRLERTEGLDAAQLANDAGLIHESALELDLAQASHERALALRESVLGAEHPETGHSHGNLGNVALARQDFDAALRHHRRALAVREAGLGADHPDVARSRANIGRIHVARGDIDSALEHFGAALEILARTVGAEHRVAGRVLNSTGDAYLARGEHALAAETYRRALAIQAVQLGAVHPETAETNADLGRVLHVLGTDREALEHLRAASGAYVALFGNEHPLTRQVVQAIATLCSDGYAPACATGT